MHAGTIALNMETNMYKALCSTDRESTEMERETVTLSDKSKMAVIGVRGRPVEGE